MKTLLVFLLIQSSQTFAQATGVTQGYCPDQDQRVFKLSNKLSDLAVKNKIALNDASTVTFSLAGAGWIVTKDQASDPDTKASVCEQLDGIFDNIEHTLKKLLKK